MVGVSCVVTPMNATCRVRPLPTVFIVYGAAAKAGMVQPAVAQLPVSFVTMFAVT